MVVVLITLGKHHYYPILISIRRIMLFTFLFHELHYFFMLRVFFFPKFLNLFLSLSDSSFDTLRIGLFISNMQGSMSLIHFT